MSSASGRGAGIGKNQGADALRPTHLVSGKNEEVDAERGDVEIDAPRCLGGIAQHVPAGLLHQPRRLRHRVDHPGLVVGEHERDIGRATFGIMCGKQVFEGPEVEAARRPDREARDRARGEPAASQHAGMLGSADIQPAGGAQRIAAQHVGRERQCHGLGGAAGEDNVLGTPGDQRRDIRTRRLHEGACPPPLGVNARRIRRDVQGIDQCGAHLPQERRTGIGIQIEALRPITAQEVILEF